MANFPQEGLFKMGFEGLVRVLQREQSLANKGLSLGMTPSASVDQERGIELGSSESGSRDLTGVRGRLREGGDLKNGASQGEQCRKGVQEKGTACATARRPDCVHADQGGRGFAFGGQKGRLVSWRVGQANPRPCCPSQLTPPPSAMRAYEATAPVHDTPRHGPWMLAGAAASGARGTLPRRNPGPPPAEAVCPSQPRCPPCRSSSRQVTPMAQPCLGVPAHVHF